ncbi:hypothetical protein GCM10009738_53070 [Kitasatospora viridis]
MAAGRARVRAESSGAAISSTTVRLGGMRLLQGQGKAGQGRQGRASGRRGKAWWPRTRGVLGHQEWGD